MEHGAKTGGGAGCPRQRDTGEARVALRPKVLKPRISAGRPHAHQTTGKRELDGAGVAERCWRSPHTLPAEMELAVLSAEQAGGPLWNRALGAL